MKKILGLFIIVLSGIVSLHAQGNPSSNGWLLNVDFSSGGARGYSLKTGFAAVGQATNDFWNFYDRDASTTPGDWRTSGTLTNLKLANGGQTTVGMSVSDAPGEYGEGFSSDPMYAYYIYPLDGGNNVVTFTNLPAGQYDVLVYAPNGHTEVVVGGTSFGDKTWYDNMRTSVPVWTEGAQYARWQNVTVGTGQPLALAFHPNTQGYEGVAGVQILSSTPPPVNGTLAAWGRNDYGQTNIPAGLSGVTAVAAGVDYTVALKNDGRIVAWGHNDYGQTNIPAGLNNVTAIAAGWGDIVALKSDGTVVAWGRNEWGQANVPVGLNNVIAIASGQIHTVALKSDGTVLAWGHAGYGETSVPAGLSGVTAVSAGANHTLALKSDGTVVAWGYNGHGETTVPAGLNGVRAVAAGGEHTVVLKSDGTVVAWGKNDYGQTNVPAGLTNVTAIAAGLWHTVALKRDGTVVAWGDNTYGQKTVPAGLGGVGAIAAGGCSWHTVALLNTSSQPSCTPPPAGLVSWWRGEGDATDAMGNNNGTLLNGATFANGEVGQAFNFTGGNGGVAHPVVQIPYSPSLTTTNATIEAWINPASQVTNSDHQGVIFGEAYGHLQLVVQPGTTGVKAVLGLKPDRSSFYTIASTNDIPIGQFSHVVGTWDGTTMRLYVNGVLHSQRTPGVQPVASGCSIFIGGFYSPTADSCQTESQYFNGQIDEVSYYNRVLAPAEIQSLYNSGSAGKCFQSPATVLAGPITNFANGSVYYLLSPASWTDAEARAVSLGGHLATINDAAENEWIHATFSGNGTRALWLGLNDAASEGHFTWISGDTSSYRNFATGEPNNFGGNENYVSLGYPTPADTTWNDRTVSAANPQDSPYGVVEIAPPPTPPEPLQILAGPITNFANGSVYYLLSPASWTDAEARAVSLGGHLATINDAAENEWLHTTFSGNGTRALWLGLNDAASEGHFTWISGDTSSYRNFATGEPNNFGGNENYVSLGYPTPADSTWNDRTVSAANPQDSPYGVVEIANISLFITTQPVDESVYVGQSATFSVTASGIAPLGYQWSFNGDAIANATNAILSLSNVQSNQAGNYAVLVSNLYGATNSTAATLTVNPAPISVAAPSGLVGWWKGDGNAVDAVAGNNGTFINPSYSTGMVSQAFSFNGSYGGVNVADQPAYQLTNSLTIETWIRPRGLGAKIISRGDNRPGLDPYELSMEYGNQVYFYITQADGTGASVVTPPIANNQWVHVAATLDGSTGKMSIYTNGVLVAQITTSVRPFGPLQANRSPGLGIGNVNDNFNNFPFNGDIDEMALYNRALSPAEIQSVYNSGSAGKFYTPVPPAITSQPASQIANVGQSATFSVTADSAQPMSYQWLKDGAPLADGGNISGSTTSTLTLNNVLGGDAGGYSVIVSNAVGSVTSSVADLTVNDPVIVTQPVDQSVVQGGTAGLVVVAAGTSPLGCQWSFNGNAIAGATNATLTLTNLHLNQAGTYNVTLANTYGTVASSNVTLTVLAQSILVYNYSGSEKVTTAGHETSYAYAGRLFFSPESTNGVFVGWAFLGGHKQYWVSPFTNYLQATIRGSQGHVYTVLGKAGDTVDESGRPSICSYLHKGQNVLLNIGGQKQISFPAAFEGTVTRVYPDTTTDSMVLREAKSTYKFVQPNTENANTTDKTMLDLVNAQIKSLIQQGYQKQ